MHSNIPEFSTTDNNAGFSCNGSLHENASCKLTTAVVSGCHNHDVDHSPSRGSLPVPSSSALWSWKELVTGSEPLFGEWA